MLAKVTLWKRLRTLKCLVSSSCDFCQPKKKKNVSHDAFGTKFGRVHMQKQDLSKLQTRKMKGLRKRKQEVVDDGESPKVAKVDS